MARRDNAAVTKAAFTKEVEPGLFVYSVDVDVDVPASTRRMIDAAVGHAEEAAVEIRQAIAARRNGDGSARG